MKVALIYPPSCDPTAPYLSVPTLTGFLRANGIDVMPIDANVEAWDALLTKSSMTKTRDRIEARIAELERNGALDHVEQLEYAALWSARGDARVAPDAIEDAKRTMRDGARFYDANAYDDAVLAIEGAQRAISAAHHPLVLDFTAYRTPFGLTTVDEVARATPRAFRFTIGSSRISRRAFVKPTSTSSEFRFVFRGSSNRRTRSRIS